MHGNTTAPTEKTQASPADVSLESWPWVTVLPSRYERGLSAGTAAAETEDPPQVHPAVPLTFALAREYETDAHAQPLQVAARNGEMCWRVPRINKDGLAVLRDLGYFVSCSSLFIDVDSPKETHADRSVLEGWRREQDEVLEALPWRATMGFYATKNGYRLVWALPGFGMDPEDFETYAESFRHELSKHGIEADPACRDWGRLYRLPRVVREEERLALPMDLSRLGNLDWRAPRARGAKRPGAARQTGTASAAPAFVLPEVVLPGQRNDTLFRFACSLRARGHEEAAILQHLHGINEDRGRMPEPLDDNDLRRIAKSAASYDKGDDNTRWPRGFMRTDAGNAERLVASHGVDLRHCHPWKKWFVWGGNRWAEDDTGEIMRRTKSTVRAMYGEAALLDDLAAKNDDAQSDDEKPDKDSPGADLRKWATKSESRARLEAMVQLATSERSIPVLPDELDADPYVLNVLNGTLDLRTFKLRPHLRKDLITKIAPVSYEPGARSDQFDRFMSEATGGDEDLAAFLQRVAGLCLLGDQPEEKLFLLHGPGGTGKTTFVEALKTMLGDYSMSADFETFIQRNQGAGVLNDVARMKGCRLVAGSEVDDGAKLAQAVVKALTGGDAVSARFLYREYFEFLPQFTLVLVANHAPRTSFTDSGMERRIVIVPFEHVVPPERRDPKVKASLRDPAIAGTAILSWAVEGLALYRREGLGIPDAVTSATAAYRDEMDPLREFLEEACVLMPEAKAKRTELYSRYANLATGSGSRHVLGRNAFYEALRTHGFKESRDGGGRCFNGIMLR